MLRNLSLELGEGVLRNLSLELGGGAPKFVTAKSRFEYPPGALLVNTL